MTNKLGNACILLSVLGLACCSGGADRGRDGDPPSPPPDSGVESLSSDSSPSDSSWPTSHPTGAYLAGLTAVRDSFNPPNEFLVFLLASCTNDAVRVSTALLEWHCAICSVQEATFEMSEHEDHSGDEFCEVLRTDFFEEGEFPEERPFLNELVRLGATMIVRVEWDDDESGCMVVGADADDVARQEGCEDGNRDYSYYDGPY